ncbi:Myophilin [Chytriomyces sp. MP71]|nr:Myophilin [Chytriomyces sp. MP71]
MTSSFQDPRAAAEEREAVKFIETVTGLPFPIDATFHQALKSGVLLCTLINSLALTEPVKTVESNKPFKQMENISAFLDRAEKMGVPAHERFMTIDLYEAKNLGQVVNCIFSLSRHAAKLGFEGPVLGPKLVEKKMRRWTMQQLNDAKHAPSRLMSFSTKVASSVGYRQITLFT